MGRDKNEAQRWDRGGSLLVRSRLRDVTRIFFDKDAVIAATDKAERRELNHAGALTRRIARQSIRRRRAVSTPGQPPTSRTGLLRDFIFYSYEAEKHTVVIGPHRFATRVDYVVPEILEYGGRVSRRDRHGLRIEVRYQARPYMRPALDKASERFPLLWEDSIRT